MPYCDLCISICIHFGKLLKRTEIKYYYYYLQMNATSCIVRRDVWSLICPWHLFVLSCEHVALVRSIQTPSLHRGPGAAEAHLLVS